MKTNHDTAEWILDTYEWLLTHQGGFTRFEETDLVLPDEEDFPVATDLDPEARARKVFELVRQHAGLAEWPCRLDISPEPTMEEALRNIPHQGTGSSGPLGTFSVDEEAQEAVISYHPRPEDDVSSMVATFAHELAHYVGLDIPVAPPGGDENHEFATDVAAVFLGFGVFMANNAFRFEQYTDGMMIGWRSSRAGYLDEADLAFALAVFTELSDIDPKSVRAWLSTNPKSYYKKALKMLDKHFGARLEELRGVVGMKPEIAVDESTDDDVSLSA